MPIADDILIHPDARRLTLAHQTAAALEAHGWDVAQAVVHSAGTADVAAERIWSRSKLTARVRLIIRCHWRSDPLVFASAPQRPGGDRPLSYSFGDDDPAQRRALAELLDAPLIARIHAAAYPREVSVVEPAHVDAPPAADRGTGVLDSSINMAIVAADAVHVDLLDHDLDVVRDDLDIDRDAGTRAALDAVYRCELLYPIVVTSAEIRSLPQQRRHDWLRIERSSLVGSERRWIDVVEAPAFASYADALTRHFNAAYRKRRFAPEGASSRS